MCAASHSTNFCVRPLLSLVITGLFLGCNGTVDQNPSNPPAIQKFVSANFPKDSWQYFLQHLPIKNAPIVDYSGKPVLDQGKHVAIIDFNVGNSDLQQCADALMRLRAEYLFAQHRCDEIGFHFCNGQYYSWKMYCNGSRPAFKGNDMHWATVRSCELTHESLRRYLNIVYAYANTVSN